MTEAIKIVCQCSRSGAAESKSAILCRLTTSFPLRVRNRAELQTSRPKLQNCKDLQTNKMSSQLFAIFGSYWAARLHFSVSTYANLRRFESLQKLSRILPTPCGASLASKISSLITCSLIKRAPSWIRTSVEAWGETKKHPGEWELGWKKNFPTLFHFL